MNIPLVSLKKRSFLTTLILFAGIIFAGLVFAHIETPDPVISLFAWVVSF